MGRERLICCTRHQMKRVKEEQSLPYVHPSMSKASSRRFPELPPHRPARLRVPRPRDMPRREIRTATRYRLTAACCSAVFGDSRSIEASRDIPVDQGTRARRHGGAGLRPDGESTTGLLHRGVGVPYDEGFSDAGGRHRRRPHLPAVPGTARRGRRRAVPSKRRLPGSGMLANAWAPPEHAPDRGRATRHTTGLCGARLPARRRVDAATSLAAVTIYGILCENGASVRLVLVWAERSIVAAVSNPTLKSIDCPAGQCASSSLHTSVCSVTPTV